MAYLRKEEAKLMRANLRRVFPTKEGWKVSLINRDKNSADVTIYKGNFKTSKTFGQYDDSEDFKTFCKVVEDVLEISVPNHDNSDIMTDYFDVGYYKSIYLGDYDKDYIYNEGKSVNWDQINKRVSALKIIKELKKD